MVERKHEGALTAAEKRIVKALLKRRVRNQDIQALVNIGRKATINSARITEVKQSSVEPATDEEVEIYQARKREYDHKTGLNAFDDERLIRSREAMMLAVQIFNGPAIKFKTEVFAVLANIAWTYLLHEYFSRRKVKIINAGGVALYLSDMLKRHDCPLSKGVKNNLAALKEIRDAVEHTLYGRIDLQFLSLYQACCLNYEKVLCELFGDMVSLRSDLGLALQFARLDFDQIVALQKHHLPQEIAALDARLNQKMSQEERDDLEYRFRVVYTLDSATKGGAHIQFLNPGSEEAEQVRNVLVKYKLSDDMYPHKPQVVISRVKKTSGRRFTSHNHIQAWRMYKARPKGGVKNPDDTDKKYCIYHTAHKDYTYSDAWIEFLLQEISSEEKFSAIKAMKV